MSQKNYNLKEWENMTKEQEIAVTALLDACRAVTDKAHSMGTVDSFSSEMSYLIRTAFVVRQNMKWEHLTKGEELAETDLRR
jgi:hypothetical protein